MQLVQGHTANTSSHCFCCAKMSLHASCPCSIHSGFGVSSKVLLSLGNSPESGGGRGGGGGGFFEASFDIVVVALMAPALHTATQPHYFMYIYPCSFATWVLFILDYILSYFTVVFGWYSTGLMVWDFNFWENLSHFISFQTYPLSPLLARDWTGEWLECLV